MVLGLVATLLLAACGTRLPDEAFEAEGQLVAVDGTRNGDQGLDAGEAAAEGIDGAALEAPTDTVAGEAPVDAGGAPAEGNGEAAAAPGPGGPNQASDVGITPTTITLGNITAESGVLGDAFAPSVRGLRAWVQATNAKGGINGRTIVLKTCDDQEVRSRALACARKLVEQDKVFALVATNTRSLGGAAQYLQDQGIPVIGIPITNSFYRYSHFWTAYGTGYARDNQTVGVGGALSSLSGGYRWFRENLGVTKAAVFTYDIAESAQAGAFITKGLQLEGFEVTAYTISFAAPSFDQAVADMERKGIEIVFDGIDDGANRKLCDALGRRQYPLEAKVSTIVSMGQSVGKDYNDTCRNVVYVAGSSVPYTATKVPAVAEFRSAFERYQPGQELHQWALEGWAQAVMVADGIRGMGPAPTRKGLEDFLRGLEKYSAGGIMTGTQYKPLDYSRPTAEHCFTIARWQDDKGGWVEATNAFPFCYPDAKQYTTPAAEQGN